MGGMVPQLGGYLLVELWGYGFFVGRIAHGGWAENAVSVEDAWTVGRVRFLGLRPPAEQQFSVVFPWHWIFIGRDTFFWIFWPRGAAGRRPAGIWVKRAFVLPFLALKILGYHVHNLSRRFPPAWERTPVLVLQLQVSLTRTLQVSVIILPLEIETSLILFLFELVKSHLHLLVEHVFIFRGPISIFAIIQT